MSLMRSIRPVVAVYLSFSLLFPGISSGRAIGLPDSDVLPPEIRHTPLTELPTGMPLRIQATVTDNVGVSEVTLIYRVEGDSEYRRVEMLETMGSDIYSADLPDTLGPRIEYYIQAIDEAGNAVLPDELQDPYVITVPAMMAATSDDSGNDSGAPADMARQDEASPEKGGVNKWVWIGLGMVAVAALASAGSDDGGNGSNGGVVGSGGTGTVTISAPVP